MVTKRPWTLLIQHVVQSNISSVVVGGGGVALRIKITCNRYGYKKTMHTNSSDYQFLGDKVYLVKCSLQNMVARKVRMCAIPSTFHNAANEHLGGLCIMNVNLNAPYP